MLLEMQLFSRSVLCCTDLQKLDLSYCVALTDCCVAPLTCLSLLEELSLAGCLWVTCSGTASSPTPNSSECSGDSKRQHSTRVDTGQATLGIHWSKLTRLRSLDMSGSGLCVPGLRGMQHLRNLEVLDISDCQVRCDLPASG